MVKARKYVLAKKIVGEAKEDDFELVEEELPPLKDGEVLVEALWLSVEPYMRLYVGRCPVKSTIHGRQISRILESKNKDFPVGKLVVGYFGWRDRSIFGVNDTYGVWPKPHLLPDFKGLPGSLSLGVLGIPGKTAYFGFLEICQPKAGEVVVVSGAAGAVGSIVGQIAKIKGCKVIGFAGSDEKVKWLTSELGFDHAFNYKTVDIEQALKTAAPDGVDCYFDNVGGKISSAVISNMRNFGRISVCGAISSYNTEHSQKIEAPPVEFITKQLKMEGFVVFRWSDKFTEGIKQMRDWILEGKLKYRETVTEGFENMPRAFIDVLSGKNVGKAVVKVVNSSIEKLVIEGFENMPRAFIDVLRSKDVGKAVVKV